MEGPEKAMELSNDLVQEAVAHANKFLQDKRWLRENRNLENMNFAAWTVFGVHQLTEAELAKVRELFQKAGWRSVSTWREFSKPNCNWKITVTADC